MFKRDAECGFRSESRSMKIAKYGLILSVFLGISALGTALQTRLTPQMKSSPVEPENISGMYSFEREGEFVQITVEMRSGKTDRSKPLTVTGYISRYGDSDSDRGAFLDYFFSKGSLDGENINFATKPVHGIAYEFTGKVVRGSVPRDKDGYYELRGTLTQLVIARDKVVSSKQREITMKLFPDLDRPTTSN